MGPAAVDTQQGFADRFFDGILPPALSIIKLMYGAGTRAGRAHSGNVHEYTEKHLVLTEDVGVRKYFYSKITSAVLVITPVPEVHPKSAAPQWAHEESRDAFMQHDEPEPTPGGSSGSGGANPVSPKQRTTVTVEMTRAAAEAFAAEGFVDGSPVPPVIFEKMLRQKAAAAGVGPLMAECAVNRNFAEAAQTSPQEAWNLNLVFLQVLSLSKPHTRIKA